MNTIQERFVIVLTSRYGCYGNANTRKFSVNSLLELQQYIEKEKSYVNKFDYITVLDTSTTTDKTFDITGKYLDYVCKTFEDKG